MFSSRLNYPPGRDERLQSGWIREAPVAATLEARTHRRCGPGEDGEAAPVPLDGDHQIAVNDGVASRGKRVKERQFSYYFPEDIAVAAASALLSAPPPGGPEGQLERASNPRNNT